MLHREFPGGTVPRILYFYCSDPSSSPGLATKILQEAQCTHTHTHTHTHNRKEKKKKECYIFQYMLLLEHLIALNIKGGR